MIKKVVFIIFLFSIHLINGQNDFYLNISPKKINEVSINDSISCDKDLIKIFNSTGLELNFSFEKEKYRPYDAFGTDFPQNKYLIYKKVSINSVGASLGIFAGHDSIFSLKKIMIKKKRRVNLNLIFKVLEGINDTLVLGETKFQTINKKHNLRYYKTGFKKDINEIDVLNKRQRISYLMDDYYYLSFKNYGSQKNPDWRVVEFFFH